MTPNEILNKQFSKSMSGYKAEEVNRFLEEIADDLRAAQRERDDLQNKIEILAEKVEEYRNDEDSLRAALIGAQKLGDGVVRDSKKKAEQILGEAERKSAEIVAAAKKEADKIVSDSKRNMDVEIYTLNKMKLEVSRFKTQILGMYNKHIEIINTIPYEEEENLDLRRPVPAEKEAAEPVLEKETVQDEDLQEISTFSYKETIEPEPEKIKPHAQRQISLMFGENYELKRDE